MSTKSVLPFVCLIIICLALAGCGAKGVDPVTIAQKDAGTTIHVKQGSLLNVTLEGNPTTGYTWEVAPGAGAGLEQQGEPEFKADSSALGSGGMMTLQFKAAQTGTTDLKLIYHRTFEPNAAPLQTFEVTIVVE
jgi:inhibitor of cysteine peptidase